MRLVLPIALAILGLPLADYGQNEWTTRDVRAGPPNIRPRDLCFGQGKFVASGLSGVVALSLQGVSWTSIQTPTEEHLRSITCENGRFHAFGEDGTEVTSIDGEVWLLADSLSTDAGPSEANGFPNTENVGAIVEGNGRFIGLLRDEERKEFVTSLDGLEWTLTEQPSFPWGTADELNIRELTFFNGYFAYSVRSVRCTAFRCSVASGGYVLTRDGVNWEAREPYYDDFLPAGGILLGIDLHNAGFGLSVDRADITTDFTDWRSVELTTLGVEGFAYGNGRFVAIGEPTRDFDGRNVDALAFYSEDAIQWREGFRWTHPLSAAVHGSSTVIATPEHVLTSIDGLSFDSTLSVPPNSFLTPITKGYDGLFVIADRGPPRLWRSRDATIWTEHLMPIADGDALSDLVFFRGVFV